MSEIYEGFTFVNENTAHRKLRLIDRSAPSPPEKTIIENLPFVQGVYDFSTMLGERIFENRDITYRFNLFEREYGNRKIAEIKLKQWLMKNDIGPLYDTHSIGYYWLGKFTSVTVEDDHKSGVLVATVVFNCYPFMIGILAEGNDIWDDFNFELDAAHNVEFTVSGRKKINLLNVGANSVVPTITTNVAMIIIKDEVTYNVSAGTIKDDLFRLQIGENPMVIQGTGTIKFTFYKEVLG